MRQVVLIFAIMSLLPSSASGAGLFRINVKKAVVLPKDTASITIIPDTDYMKMVLDLTRNDGKKVHLEKTGIKSDSSFSFTWTESEGSWYYEGFITATWSAEEVFRVPMDFEVFAGKPLNIDIPRTTIDMEGQQLIAKVDRSAEYGELELYGVNGLIDKKEIYYGGVEAGEALEVSWFTNEEVIKFKLTIFDVWGFSAYEEVTPWSLEIPHEDVVFETNMAVIRAGEEPKLVKAAEEARTILDRYGHIVTPKLYVAGYTDTVGAAPENRSLSERRAKAIASWFRKAGFQIPIYYQGFGEDALAVQTADGVDMEANRRAAYVLAAHPPHGKHFPGGNWQRLP